MAEEEPEVENEEVEEEEEKKPSKIKGILLNAVVFLLITGLAAGGGYGVSMFITPPSVEKEMSEEKEEKGKNPKYVKKVAKDDKDKKKGEGEEEAPEQLLQGYAKPLAPILTNLASPKDVWLRLELAVVTDSEATPELLEQIHQDLFAYMRTVKLHHVEGPSGYLNLRSQLTERAAIRSEGEVSKVLIRTLLFE